MSGSANSGNYMKTPPRIAIFASGNGSNAQRIAEYFTGTGLLEISAIYCNNPKAYVLERAKLLGIPSLLFNRNDFYNTTSVLEDLRSQKTDWIILAGFLWLIPGSILKAFPQRIVNIHPALLPAYGGKGMFGMKVHEAVIAAGEKQSGITIHHVNEQYDEGDIIFQATCEVQPGDTPEMLAENIHELEYEYFPVVIGKLVAESRR
jgi:phosphoribosylglycinamide formyltransferase-1